MPENSTDCQNISFCVDSVIVPIGDKGSEKGITVDKRKYYFEKFFCVQ